MTIEMDYSYINADMFWGDWAQVITWLGVEHHKRESKLFVLLHITLAQTASNMLSAVHFSFAFYLQGKLLTSLPASLPKLRK